MIHFDNPLPLRMKLGLTLDPVDFGYENSWVVKDPISLSYFRLREEERLILSLIDGQRSLKAVCRDYEARLSPQRISKDKVLDFISRLYRQGLVTSEAAGQAAALLDVNDRQRRANLRRRLGNPFAIRFRGIDPRRLLDRLLPWTRVLFSPVGVVLAFAALVAAIVIAAVRWKALVEELSDQYDAGLSAWLVVIIVLGSVKVLHELGHGLCCRNFGGDCHELGLMLFLGVPSLYCNVTDSWRFPGKWRRICVSAAGMYFELILASIATLGWSSSAPGIFHHACLSVMAICSVSTIVFNGNPLMRYDGYFILADLVDQPNFGATARDVFHASVRQALEGRNAIDRSRLPGSNWLWFNLYHVLSTAYRWTLTYSIVLFLFAKSREIQAESITRVLFLAIVATAMLGVWQSFLSFRSEQRMRNASSVRVACTVSVISLLAVAFFYLPMPRNVWGTLDLSLNDAQTVYAEASGRLVEQTVQPGSSIKSGEVIAKLVDDDLDARVVELSAEHARLQVRRSFVEAERFADPTAALRLPQLNEEIKELADRLSALKIDRERLTLRARRDGIVMPAEVALEATAADRTLRPWVGTPYDPKNLGCRLERGTQYCTVGDPQRWDASLSVHPDDIPSVRVGQAVDIKFDELPDEVYSGTVAEIMHEETTRDESHDDQSSSDTERYPGKPKMSFAVRVVLSDPDMVLRRGLNGTAKIVVAPEPVGVRLLRWCSRTFYLEL